MPIASQSIAALMNMKYQTDGQFVFLSRFQKRAMKAKSQNVFQAL